MLNDVKKHTNEVQRHPPLRWYSVDQRLNIGFYNSHVSFTFGETQTDVAVGFLAMGSLAVIVAPFVYNQEKSEGKVE